MQHDHASYTQKTASSIAQTSDTSQRRSSQFTPFGRTIVSSVADFLIVGAALFVCAAVAGIDGSLLVIPWETVAGLAALQIWLQLASGLYDRAELDARALRCIAMSALAVTALAAVWPADSMTVGLTWTLPAWLIAAVGIAGRRLLTPTPPLLGQIAGSRPVLLLGAEVDEQSERHVARRIDLSQMAAASDAALSYVIDTTADSAGLAPCDLRVVIAPKADEIRMAERVIESLRRLRQPYAVVLPMKGLVGGRTRGIVATGADSLVWSVERNDVPGSSLIKRLFDMTAAGLGLIALAPIFIVFAAILSMEKGPVFFAQPRVGRNGRRFMCLKFRSMRPDAQDRLEELLRTDPEARREWETHQKLENDPRITPFGHFLRATSLDELPQLINVVKGDMSLVGPRPIIAPEIPGYDGDAQYYEAPEFGDYTCCNPGITGLWQVSGRAKTSHSERVRLDGWYTRNWSLWLDFVILARTVRAVIRRTGS
ncbi:sugar transferase [Pontivivens ytuae]|nr:sugar transferase [Pontivivens ytuae]